MKNALVIIALMVVPSLISLILPSVLAGIVGYIGIIFVAVILMGLFSSVLFKGIGENRTISETLMISFSGIFSLICYFAALYLVIGFAPSGGQPSSDIFEALYFSVVTWTTLGYGDFVPSEAARHLVMVQAMLGYVTMALLISVFTSAISKAT